MSTISQSNKEDNIKIVSIGTLELTLHLTLTKSQASQYKVNIKDYNTAKDLSQLFESDNDNSISKHKILDMKQMMQNDKSITSGFTISVYTDGISFVNSIDDDCEEYDRMIKHTTYFDNQHVEKNTMVKYKPRWIYTNKQLLTD